MPLLESHEIETAECRSQHSFTDGEMAIAGQNSTKEEEAAQDKGNESNIPFDRGWAWMIVLGAFIVNFLVIGMINASSGILMTEFQAKYESSSSHVMGIFGLVHTLRNLLGIGSAFSFMPTLATIAQYFRKRRGLANGLGFSGCGIGALASAPLTRYLFDYYGSVSFTLLILGGIMSNICFGGSLFRPVTSYTRSRHVQKDKLHLPVNVSDEVNNDLCDTTSVKSRKRLFVCGCRSGKKCPVLLDLTLFKSALFLVYSISIMLIYPGFQTYFVMVSDHAKHAGIPVQQAAFLVSIVGISDVTGRIFFGFFADFNLVPKYFLFVGCTILGGTAICFVSCVSNYIGFAMLSAAVGLCGGGYYCLIMVIVVEKFGVERAVSSISIVSFFMGTSVLIATPVTGALKDITGDWSASFIFCGLLMLVGSSFVFLDPLATKFDEKKHIFLDSYVHWVNIGSWMAFGSVTSVTNDAACNGNCTHGLLGLAKVDQFKDSRRSLQEHTQSISLYDLQ